MDSISLPKRFNISVYDLFILILTGLSLLSLAVIALPFANNQAKQIAFTLDTFLSILFLLDFFFTLMSAPDKRAYLKWGWLDFLGSLPYLPLLRLLRIFRAVRSIRFLRQNSLSDLRQVILQRPERTTFFFVVLFAIILVSLSSYSILQIEELSPESNIETAGDALWWSIVTISTVGYGDHVPTTSGGRIIAILLMFVGISIFGALTSFMSASFVKSGDRQRQEIDDITDRLSAIEEQLKTLTKALQEKSDEPER
jgi:voltage-gated potassium channel